MGLDVVELMLEFEEEFGVSITDDDAVCFSGTLGGLHDFLLAKCAGVRRSDCPVRRAFYRLRRAIMQAWDLERQSLRPTTLLLPLLGTWGRQRRWISLQQELRLELPRLEHWAGAGVFWGGTMTALGVMVVVIVASGDLYLALAGAVMGLLPGVLGGYLVGVLWIPTVGSSFQTLGQLARILAAWNDDSFRTDPAPSTVDDPIWDRLCSVIVRELGVDRAQLDRHTRFIEDLGF